jgi:hypothetical protein
MIPPAASRQPSTPLQVGEIPAMAQGDQGFDDRELRSLVYTGADGKDRQILVPNGGRQSIGSVYDFGGQPHEFYLFGRRGERHRAPAREYRSDRPLGRVLAAAGENVLIDHGLRRFLATTTAHTDRQARLHIAQRRGAVIHRFMDLTIGNRTADAYVHDRSAQAGA